MPNAAIRPFRLMRRATTAARPRNAMLANGEPRYGITTGFGDSVDRQISPAQRAGNRRPTCSLGASGDLVPLRNLAGALLGDGHVRYRGEVWSAAEALTAAGLQPVALEATEGLALINGTSFAAAFTALGWWDAAEIAAASDIASSLAVEVLRGNASHFHPFVHENKPHPGQVTSAATIRELLGGSALTTTYEAIVEGSEELAGREYVQQAEKIQDPYSLRCAPHVNGVLRDSLAWSRSWIEMEVNASTDNPLLDAESEQLHHGGNFLRRPCRHGG